MINIKMATSFYLLNQLPPEVLTTALSFLTYYKDLLNARKVCKLWKLLIDANVFKNNAPKFIAWKLFMNTLDFNQFIKLKKDFEFTAQDLFYDENRLLKFALKNNSVHLSDLATQFGFTKGDIAGSDVKCLTHVARTGNTKTLEWLINYYSITKIDIKVRYSCIFKEAAKNNCQDILTWITDKFEITKYEFINCIRKAFSGAACGGHLRILDWLQSKFELCTSDVIYNQHEAFTFAIVRGHLEVVQWMSDKFSLSIGSFRKQEIQAFTIAAHRGHLPILKWMAENHSMNVIDLYDFNFIDSNTFGKAVKCGHLNVFKWLLGYFMPNKEFERVTVIASLSTVVDTAVHNNDCNIIHSFMKTFDIQQKDLMNGITSNQLYFFYTRCKHDDHCIFDALEEILSDTPLAESSFANTINEMMQGTGTLKPSFFISAAEEGSTFILKHLTEDLNYIPSLEIMETAVTLTVRNGHIDVLIWLRKWEHSLWELRYTIVKNAAAYGHIEILIWIKQFAAQIEKRCPSVDSETQEFNQFIFRNAVNAGKIYVLYWLSETNNWKDGISEPDIFYAFRDIVTKNYFYILQWFVQNFLPIILKSRLPKVFFHKEDENIPTFMWIMDFFHMKLCRSDLYDDDHILIDTNISEKLLTKAAKNGSIPLIQWLFNHIHMVDFQFKEIIEIIFTTAVNAGFTDVLDWIISLKEPYEAKSILTSANRETVTGPSSFNMLHCIEWIIQNFRFRTEDVYTIFYELFSRAAFKGNIYILEWLLENYPHFRNENNDVDYLFIICVENGQKNIMTYLQTKFIISKETMNIAFSKAAMMGRLDILKWLVEDNSFIEESTITSSFCDTLKKGHLQIAKWFVNETHLKDYDFYVFESFLIEIIAKRNVHIIEWLVLEGYLSKQNIKTIQSYEKVYKEDILGVLVDTWFKNKLGSNHIRSSRPRMKPRFCILGLEN